MYLIEVARQPFLLDLIAELRPAYLWLDPVLSSGQGQAEPDAYLRGLIGACRAMGGEVVLAAPSDDASRSLLTAADPVGDPAGP